MDRITTQWLERAEYDLGSAETLFKSGRHLYVAFMCQQCIEKAIKAEIASKGKTPPYLHNLLRLAETASLMDILDENQRLLLADLNPYYIKARYGEYKDSLSKICDAGKAAQFIRETKGFFSWLKARIK